MFLFVRCLGVWAKNHQHFDENYREFPSKLFSKCSRHHLDARYTYWKKSFFIILLGFWAKSFRKCCQKYLVDFRSHSLKNDIIWEKNLVSTISCGFWVGIVQTAGKKSRLACENCLLHVQRNVLTRNIFLKDVPFEN